MGIRFHMLFFIPFYFLIFSHASTKTISFFESQRDTAFSFIIDTIEATIQKNELHNVYISSHNKVTSANFNIDNSNKGGYPVDNERNIQGTTLGNVTTEGLIKSQLKGKIIKSIQVKMHLPDSILQICHIK